MLIGTFAQDPAVPIEYSAQDEAGIGARTAAAIFATGFKESLGLHQNVLL